MIKLERNILQRAIERAKALHPRVLFAGERRFRVISSRDSKTAYNVEFRVVNNLRLGSCDCPAGQKDQACYHLAAAAQANIMIQSARRHHV